MNKPAFRTSENARQRPTRADRQPLWAALLAMPILMLSASVVLASPDGSAVKPAPPEDMPFAFATPFDESAMVTWGPADIIPVESGDKQLDTWWETWMTWSAVPAGGDVREHIGWIERFSSAREEGPFDNDPWQNKVGDSAVLFDAASSADRFAAVAVHPGMFLKPWSLDTEWTLHLWVKGEGLAGSPALIFIDVEGRRASGSLEGFASDGEWHEIAQPLSGLNADAGFDLSQVQAVQFEQDWPAAAKLWLDGVHFRKGSMEIGVTDKTLDQRIDEATRTRLYRMQQSILNSKTLLGSESAITNGQVISDGSFLGEFSLWPRPGLDLEEANEKLVAHYTKELEKYGGENPRIHWAGIPGYKEIGMYWMFGSRSPVFPGRLSEEAEGLILEYLWAQSHVAADIHCARLPSLWVFSSENHDSCWRSQTQSCTAIFVDHPEYAEHTYPDYGFGPGFPRYGYPPLDAGESHGYFTPRGERGPLHDGEEYGHQEHFEAWVDLWHRYFDDRARVNFFMEQGGGYRETLLRHMYRIYLFSRDEELSRKARKFIDLFWVKYAQNSLAGYQGGPKLRHSKSDTFRHYDNRHNPFVTFLLGGPANGMASWYWRNQVMELLVSDYELPRVAWLMMLDKKGMGEYVYRARAVIEENVSLPRPVGTENMFMLDGPQRSFRYRYNTPDYLMSSSIDSPQAVYNHLSRSQAWQGLLAPWKGAILSPIAKTDEIGNRVRSIENPLHGAQDRNVFVGHYSTLKRVASPPWFPAAERRPFVSDDILDEEDWAMRGFNYRYYRSSIEMLVHGWDEVVEAGGWVFCRAGHVYGAAMIVEPVFDEKGFPAVDPEVKERVLINTEPHYTWNEDRTIFGTSQSDVIILEAGTEAEYGSFEAFQEAIQANRLELWSARLAYVLIYQGAREGANEIRLNLTNDFLPAVVGGEDIEYELPWTWKSPFIESEYKSGKIRVEYGGEDLDLEF